MRTSLDILEDIRSTLKKQDLLSERQELDSEIRASTTANELTLRAGSKLLDLQVRSNQVDNAIGHLIKEFISYCNSIGLYPKRSE
jgi:hypothetical protein